MKTKHKTLHIVPYPPLHTNKSFRHYEVRPGFKKPMATAPTLKEAAEYAFQRVDNIHVSRVKHTRPDPNNPSHWRKYTPKEINELKGAE
ncbi:hypothetical protein FAI41_03270 [Acetobacteraceae bacterium]|nr:hypothetical protein FAI41_03270 [Acetobacteraceae bacterium]